MSRFQNETKESGESINSTWTRGHLQQSQVSFLLGKCKIDGRLTYSINENVIQYIINITSPLVQLKPVLNFDHLEVSKTWLSDGYHGTISLPTVPILTMVTLENKGR